MCSILILTEPVNFSSGITAVSSKAVILLLNFCLGCSHGVVFLFVKITSFTVIWVLFKKWISSSSELLSNKSLSGGHL